MFHPCIKEKLLSAISDVASNLFSFSPHPGKNFMRIRKIPPDKLNCFLISQGSSSTTNELLDFFGMGSSLPTNSTFNQQRAKLKPEALEAVFHRFNYSLSDLTFFCDNPSFSSEYYVSEEHSLKGFSSMHLNVLYDLHTHTYIDALLQSVHLKDEFKAFCTMVARYLSSSATKTVFIGDQGYSSYNILL